MRIRSMLAAVLLAACGGSTSTAPFVGNYACTYTGTYTLTGSSMVHTNPAYTTTAVIAAGTTSDLTMTGILAEGLAGTCVATLKVTGSATATFMPAMQSCSFTESGGNQQTNTGTATLTVNGSNATLAGNGTFTGMTSASVPYSGAYQGSWNCTKS
jgi:hypothetical protein